MYAESVQCSQTEKSLANSVPVFGTLGNYPAALVKLWQYRRQVIPIFSSSLIAIIGITME